MKNMWEIFSDDFYGAAPDTITETEIPLPTIFWNGN